MKNKMNTENKKIENIIMDKIMSDKVKMKPKWYFILGSVISYIGIVGSIIGATFFTNLTMFLIKKRGPGTGRIDMMIESFPLWIPLLATALIILGIWMLKKYDFSYKKNFLVIIIVLLTAVFISAQIIDLLGLNDIWSKRGPMRTLYPEHRINQAPGYVKPKNNKKY